LHFTLFHDWKYLDNKNIEEIIYDFFEITVELQELWFSQWCFLGKALHRFFFAAKGENITKIRRNGSQLYPRILDFPLVLFFWKT